MQSRTSALSDRHQGSTWVALVLIVILGMALGLHEIDSKSLWSDEIVSVQRGSRGLAGTLRSLRDRNNAPLYYLVLHPFTLISTDEFNIRLPSLFFGLLGICACYQLGRVFFNKSVGVIAALFLALSPLHLRYAQEARMYSLFELLSMLSLYFFYRGVETRRTWPWLGYIIVTLLSMYTQYFTAMYIVVQGVFLLIATLITSIARRRGKAVETTYRSAWLGFAASLVIIAVVFAPWWSYASPSTKGGGLFQRFDAVLWGTFRCLWAGKETLLSYILGVIALIGSISCVWTQPAKKGGILLSWVLLPIGLAYLFLLMVGNFYAIRYLIFLLPVYVVLAAYGVTVIGHLLADIAGRHVKHAIHRSSVSLVLALLVAGPLNALPLLEYYDARKPPWREVGAFLDQQVGPGDVVLVQPFWQTLSISFYSSLTQLSVPETLDQVVDAAATHSVIWFVRTDDVGQTEPSRAITQWLEKRGAITLTFNGSLSQRLRDQEINRTQRDILVSLCRDSWHGDSAVLQESLDLIANIEALWPGALRVDLTLARLYARYGLPGQAIECYQRALEDLPDHLASAAYLELGVLQREQGNTLQSVEAFRQAIKAYPNHGWYHLQLADTLIAAGMPTDAVAEYREAARWLPDLETNAWLHLQLGMAYREAGRPKEAIAAYERALELDGNNPEALGWLEILR